MSIPNVKRYRISNPADGAEVATLMAVVPREADVDAYLQDAASRFDWKGWRESKAQQYKIRVGQQKQRKTK